MDETGNIIIGKASSAPHDFSVGILDSIRAAAESMGMSLEDLLRQTKLFSHATTVATNAVITRSGAKTGLITTADLEDTKVSGEFEALYERLFGRGQLIGKRACK